ncbi:MAG TPA: efflux RND transporter periplasmic adaptor subunit [Anaerolineae bacterium]|nr:efflux RND transporter periplasmic adaptor subunit [Anaerolineae bacterium]
MFRKKWFWIVLILLVLAGGGYAAYTVWFAPKEVAETTPTLETGTVTVGDLTISATGSGQLVASSEVNLAFSASGQLKGLTVEVGDTVKAGDVLAWMDDTSARQAVGEAQQAVLQAEQSLALAEAQAELTLMQAQAAYDTAKSDWEDLVAWAPDEEEIALAQANLTSAQSSYQNTVAKSRVDQTISSRISLDQAIASLADAQETYANAMAAGRDWEKDITTTRENAAAALLKAQQNLGVAQANYNLATINSTTADIQSARAKVLSAQTELETLQTAPDAAEITAAEIKVHEATLALEQAKFALADVGDGKTAAARDAELALEQARLNLTNAQTTLAGATLIAPFDGTVTAVNGEVGDTVNGTVIALANLGAPLLQFWVEEADMGSVAKGYPVKMIFEALPDYVYSGEIVRVDPMLTTVGNTSAVQIYASINVSEYPVMLLGSMNADVEIVAGEAKNALLVPVQALREMEDGQYTVFVVKEDGTLETRVVEVGLMDYVNAEVKSGLAQGEVVSLANDTGSSTTIQSSINTQQQMMGGPPDGGGFMPGGMP